jgi:sirohydrochlorin ferrochelatase
LKGIVLIGHGSKLPYYIEVIELHKSRIEKLRIFDEVKIAYASIEPRVEEVVRGMKSDVVYLVPLFVSHGVHIQDIPRTLGLNDKGEFDGKRFYSANQLERIHS